jgi:hypothetical protein
MSNVLSIKKTAAGYEVSNGEYSINGPDRATLLKIIDSLEKEPATKEQDKKNASRKDLILECLKNGSYTSIEIAKHLGVTDGKKWLFSSILFQLYKKKLVKRKKNKDGIFEYSLK